MRWHLLKTYDKIYTIDLHGNSKKKETAKAPIGVKLLMLGILKILKNFMFFMFLWF